MGLDRIGSARADTQRRRPARQVARAGSRAGRRVRLLYLYPSSVDDALIDAICATGVPYFDLSLQHVSQVAAAPDAPTGSQRALQGSDRAHPRSAPEAALRSNFILGFPGETEEDHDELLGVPRGDRSSTGQGSSRSPRSRAPPQRVSSRRCPRARPREAQGVLRDPGRSHRRRRQSLVGSTLSVLVDSPGVARSYREAPEIDGVDPRADPFGDRVPSRRWSPLTLRVPTCGPTSDDRQSRKGVVKSASQPGRQAPRSRASVLRLSLPRPTS